MKKWVSLMMLAIATFAVPLVLTGCNTIEGAGKDIEKGGEAIQDAAK